MDEASLRLALAGIPLGGMRYYESLGSTNEAALAWAGEGAPDLALVYTEEQTSGRGRAGRSWFSRRGAALAFSLLLRPDPGNQWALPRLTALGALAVVEALPPLHLTGEIKWPNDVLIDGRKVAGILTEMDGSGPQRVVVLGVGVNLNSRLEDFPAELRDKAGSLCLASGAPVDRARFTGRLLGALEARYEVWQRDGFASIAAAWRRLTPLLGRRIRVQEPGAVVEGTVIDLSDDGALRLRLADGAEHRVIAGDVSLIGADATRD